MTTAMQRAILAGLGSVLVSWLILATGGVFADDLKATLEAQKERIRVVNRVKPAVVALFAPGGNNGGSGVLIDKDGFLLTNFHVVQATGPVMKCGLPDGLLYDGVLVGLDRVGDVALVKLLPKTEGKPFPYAVMGDSDTVKAGDWSLAMGNPFLLATDFTPTVTYGLVSGTNRYQYPAGSILEYTDCIQIDTSINPGNSGGPLFNMKGELIGINGRGSFEKRGRVNSGVGYAISINQIKNFLEHMYAGIDTDHATLGAKVASESDDVPTLTVRDILDDCDARRRGLEVGDELISFAGRSMSSVNEFKNVLGIYPKDWRLPMTYRQKEKRREVLVRLMGLLPAEINQPGNKDLPEPPKGKRPAPPPPSGPGAKFYNPKKGYANYYFNELAQKNLVSAFAKHGDFSKLTGDWTLAGTVALAKDRGTRVRDYSIAIQELKGESGIKPVVKMDLDGLKYSVEPLKTPSDDSNADDLVELMYPPDSGGFLMALYQYRRFLTQGAKGFEGGNFHHGGKEPFYPPATDGKTPPGGLRSLRVDTEVIRTEHAAVPAKWYFDMKTKKLLGFEITLRREDDPCEVYLSDYKEVGGRLIAHRLEVRRGYEPYGVFEIKTLTTNEAK